MATDRPDQTVVAPRARLIPVHAEAKGPLSPGGCFSAFILGIVFLPALFCCRFILEWVVYSAGITGQLAGYLPILSVPLVIVPLTRLMRSGSLKGSRRWLTENPPTPEVNLAEWAKSFTELPSLVWDPRHALLIRKLHDQGQVGVAMCVAKAPNQFCSTAVPSNFEARLLSDRNPGFIALASELTPPVAHLGHAAHADPNEAAAPWAAWRMRARLHSFWAKLAAMFLLYFWGRTAWIACQSGSISTELLVLSALLALFIIGPQRWERRNKQFFVVPGGLLVRQFRSSHSAQPQLKLYDAATSVLGVVHGGLNDWTLHVADAAGEAQLAVSPSEAEMALRAWLSPIPPPRVEELSDLAEQ